MISMRRTIAAAVFTSAVASAAVWSGCSKPSDTQSPENTAEPATPTETATATPTAVEPEKTAMMAIASTVRGPDGSEVNLASAWESGPAVVIFYRGHW